MATQQASAPRIVTGTEFRLLTARPVTRIVFICIPIALTGVVQGFWYGWNASALTLLVGAVFAVIGVVLHEGALERKERSWTAVGLGLGGFAPYLFGAYLTFVRGVWNGRALFNNFSFGGLFALIAYVYLGYRMVYWTSVLSDIGESVRSGRMVLSDKAESI